MCRSYFFQDFGGFGSLLRKKTSGVALYQTRMATHSSTLCPEDDGTEIKTSLI